MCEQTLSLSLSSQIETFLGFPFQLKNKFKVNQ